MKNATSSTQKMHAPKLMQMENATIMQATNGTPLPYAKRMKMEPASDGITVSISIEKILKTTKVISKNVIIRITITMMPNITTIITMNVITTIATINIIKIVTIMITMDTITITKVMTLMITMTIIIITRIMTISTMMATETIIVIADILF